MECRSQLTNNCQFSTATMTKGCRGSTRCQLQQLQQQQQQLVDLPHLGGGNRQSIVRIQRSRLNFSGRRLVPESEKELVPAFSKESAENFSKDFAET